MEHLFKRISAILLALVIFDVTIAVIGFFFPELWFRAFHGVPYNDPQGFLPRCAANWTAFALIQLIALFRWEKDPVWLAMVSAARLSDIFTDLAYFWFCSDITWLGRVSFLSAGPINLLLCWYFLNSYRHISKQ
ncbi:MAG: hypothetical protein PHE84_14025 [bacterium]|nr:hypothetical protein [bacterium]